MNILWLPNFLPLPENNGGKVVVMNRLRGVAAEHHIHMISVNSDKASHEELKELYELCDSVVEIEPREETLGFELRSMLKGPLNISRLYYPEWAEAIEKCLSEKSIDLINIDIPMVYQNLRASIKRHPNIPVIINQQNTEFQAVRSKAGSDGASLIRQAYSLLEGARLQKWETKLYHDPAITGYTFLSDKDMAYFTQHYPTANKPMLLTPIGTNVHPKADYQTKHGHELVFVASFDYYPNIQATQWFCRQVLPLILKEVPDAHLTLVGRKPDAKVLACANEHVEVTGTVAELFPYYERSDVVIVPILTGGGVKTKLSEAGGYFRPAVSTSPGIAGTCYKDGQDVIVADEPAAFAKACAALLKDPEKARALAEHFHQTTAERYQWSGIVKEYSRFLTSFGKKVSDRI